MNLSFILLAVLTAGQAAIIAAQLAVLVAVVVTFSTVINTVFRIPEGAWKGWARRLVTWAVSVALVFACWGLAPYGSWVPQIPVLFNPWWASCIVEGILLGGLANGIWTQEWVQKFCELIEGLLSPKKKLH